MVLTCRLLYQEVRILVTAFTKRYMPVDFRVWLHTHLGETFRSQTHSNIILNIFHIHSLRKSCPDITFPSATIESGCSGPWN